MAWEECVRVRAPASSANLGSGFDAIALAHDSFYDEVEACVSPRTASTLVYLESLEGPYAIESGGATTALEAARAILERLGVGGVRVSLSVYKGVPPGRGLGSSGASAAAAAVAVSEALHRLLGTPLPGWEELVEAAGRGEAAAAGAPHYDNVAASILGGIVVVARSHGRLTVYKIKPPSGMHIALLVPGAAPGPGKTRAMRSILPRSITLGEASAYASRAALLAAALASGDLVAAGKAMMMDELVEPRRARLTPCYEEAVAAALNAGAYGASLSGAGPSIIALAGGEAAARRVADAMREAYTPCGDAVGVTARPRESPIKPL